MKKALNLFGMYFLFFISGTIAIAIIYSFYIDIQNYVAGSEIKFFSNVDMINSLFTALYYMIILICPLVSYYRIRHPGGIWQFIFYVLICLITWVVLLPCLYFAEDFCYKRLPHQTKEVTLSKNYFRQLDNKIYYFIDDFNISEADSKTEETTAVIIDTDENGKVKYKNIKNDKLLDLIKKAAPYNELLVGAKKATCFPPITALNPALIAISVLPYPTSPQSKRSIGTGFSISCFISLVAFN